MAFCYRIMQALKPELAKTMAIWKAMIMCSELEINEVFFESDCLRFVKASMSLDPSSSEISLVVHDIRIFWHAQPGWQRRFDYRETKMVAHELAK